MFERIGFLWSRAFLLSPWLLHALFWVNALGTVYGYEWYRKQLIDTWVNYGEWLVVFVPDSPTASLFFCITLLYLLRDVRAEGRSGARLASAGAAPLVTWRGVLEALAVITQVKYGIWAVAIIFWGASQGDALQWQDWMLVVSHSAMAVETLLYMRFYRFTALAVAVGAIWTLTNDFVDYTFGVYPWLPRPLWDQVGDVQIFTVALSALGIACAYTGVKLAAKYRV
ncbi:DUF1405 domain-containing protein [Paenibacillus sp.]|uniref:DUF1405 domain-containing protein n=1 Tax=Paenibacillus sp. TaxID=58172 RepID=UPI002D3041D1|nr:DUF1405 domain-containing protein [Paenibacillus sp.]HZG85266.1 DUF1405 domain-containing protein [Paenibacillus sp.]